LSSYFAQRQTDADTDRLQFRVPTLCDAYKLIVGNSEADRRRMFASEVVAIPLRRLASSY